MRFTGNVIFCCQHCSLNTYLTITWKYCGRVKSTYFFKLKWISNIIIVFKIKLFSKNRHRASQIRSGRVPFCYASEDNGSIHFKRYILLLSVSSIKEKKKHIFLGMYMDIYGISLKYLIYLVFLLFIVVTAT